MSTIESEVVETLPSAPAPGMQWQPVVGPETLDLLDHLRLPEESKSRLLEEAVSVLGRCVSPGTQEGEQTGLVVGYVQSGKTMSFTTVAALARDNGYALIILIAGTAVPLLRQSTQRLHSDLRLGSRADRVWLPVSSDEIAKPSVRQSLKDALAEWRDPDASPGEKRTILITAMKHHGHLRKVTTTLHMLDLDGLPALIIDDEADQASLNARVLSNKESTTYTRIKHLRTAIPHRSYLQYTATPQAPLLINIIDILSPRFAEVLTPGPEYAGGTRFFASGSKLTEVIPTEHLSSDSNGEPPESLLEAMRIFWVGVAAGMILDDARGNRSMMVHPSQRTTGHNEFYLWVEQTRETWRLILESADEDEDKQDLLTEFRAAYVDLARTANDIPDFDLIAKKLPRAVRKTIVMEINARLGETPRIEWNNHYAWILVGGQAMDRGFTVEGLTVTYMPRGMGVGNADTVQQRARFFGYKGKYLGYCRVFLDAPTLDAYKKYVEHEEDVRRRLIAHRDSGEPLTAWKRAFFLDSELQPTRKNVLDIAYARAAGENEWYVMRKPYVSFEVVASNQMTVEAFLSNLVLSADPGSPERTKYQVHLRALVKIETVLADLLTRIQIADPSDSSQFTLLQLVLSEHLRRQPDASCWVYQMSSGETRERALNSKGEIVNLFQGAHPSRATRQQQVGDIYRGDREIATSQDRIVVQIHTLNLTDGGKDVLPHRVPALAVFVPAAASRALLVQEQPAQSA